MKAVHSSQFIVHSKKKSTIRELLTVNQSGQMLVIAVIFITVALVLTTSLFSRLAAFIKFGSNSILREQALNVAEAGIDNALFQLNQTAGAYNGETNTQVGTTGTFTITITDKSSNLKTITSTGYIPTNLNPVAKRIIKVDALIGTDQISFRYAVQSGQGGVNMSNNATINGTIYSNGNIQGSNGALITGDAYAAGTISSPYPTVNGVKRSNQPQSQMPNPNIQSFIDAATAGGTTNCSGTCNLNSGNFGPQKYVGNITIVNNAVMDMKGPVYVTGNVTVSNSGTVNLDPSFGSTGTLLIADGTVTVSNNGAFNPTSASPKGYILVITNSTSASAMSISNNGANAIFYALSGGALMANNSQVTALVAKSLAMSNNSSLNYDSGLASAQFSQGPGGSWQVKKGTYFFAP